MANQLAVQFYTLREFTETPKDFADCCAKIRKIGYTGVQLSAVKCMDGDQPKLSAGQAKQILHDNGLTCAGTHRPISRLANNTREEIEFHNILECDYTAVGSLGNAYPNTPDGMRQFIEDTSEMRLKLALGGVRFGYHNHAHEFVGVPCEDGRMRPIDVILEESPEDLMFEVDTYWVAEAGADPSDILFDAAGRIPVIHVKDKEWLPENVGAMAPVGEGNLSWGAILSVALQGGTEWFVVEQDVCRRDPFDCLKSSFEYLNEAIPEIKLELAQEDL